MKQTENDDFLRKQATFICERVINEFEKNTITDDKDFKYISKRQTHCLYNITNHSTFGTPWEQAWPHAS